MAGDTLELTFDNENKGSRRFAVKGDEDINFENGGYNSETTANGNGSTTNKLTAVTWKLEGLMLSIDVNAGDLEYIRDISGDPKDTEITWEHIDGYVYSMKGRPNGERKYNSNSGYLPLTLAGGGKPKKIA